MATDNRHRPGPAFRCPQCKSHQIKVYEEVGIRRNSSARRRVRRVFRVSCPTCPRSWLSVHPQARDQFDEQARRTRHCSCGSSDAPGKECVMHGEAV